MPKTALVTGATGFIGTHLCHKLVKEGYHVVGIGARDENGCACHEMYICDLDKPPLDEIPKIDVCFHQAANNDTLLQNNMAMCDANVVRPTRLFDKLASRGCRRFVFASSCSVYGNSPPPFSESTKASPLNPYAKSKLMFDNYMPRFIKMHGVTAVGLRYTNVYGSSEAHKGRRASMAHQMAAACLSGRTVTLFRHGEQIRDWVHVDDVVRANLLAAECEESLIANIGLGVSHSFNELRRQVSDACGKELGVAWIDCPFASSYQAHTAVEISLANEKLGYQPAVDLSSGVRLMVDQMKRAGLSCPAPQFAYP